MHFRVQQLVAQLKVYDPTNLDSSLKGSAILKLSGAMIKDGQITTGTITMAHHQIDRLKAIYFMLNASYQPESCVGIVGILGEAFQSIGKHDESSTLRDLSLLSYIFHIENIETTSFEVLLVISEHLKELDIVKLLADCYNEAKKDKVLFQQITKK